MRRIALGVAGLALSAACSGCMAVSATDNSKGWKTSKDVVAVGNEVYIVDTRTGHAQRVDLTKAEPCIEARSSYNATEMD